MLAGDGAAESDCQVHDFAECQMCSLRLVAVGGVVHDQRVGVAVARVGDDRAHDVALVGDGLDTFDERGQRGQWHADVFQQQVAETLDSRNRESSCRGEGFTFLWVVGGEHVGGVIAFEDLHHEGDLLVAVTGRVGLGDEHRPRPRSSPILR